MIHRAIALSAATLGLLAGSLAAQSPAPANPANEQSYESIAVQPAASVEASATGAAIGSNVYVTPHGRSDREVLINAQLPAQRRHPSCKFHGGVRKPLRLIDELRCCSCRPRLQLGRYAVPFVPIFFVVTLLISS